MIVDSLRQIAPLSGHDHGASPGRNGVGVREQRRSRVIAMSVEERDVFLGEQLYLAQCVARPPA